MKKLLFFLLLSITSLAQNIKGTYEFQFRENRTPTGWDKVNVNGLVIFYEDTKTNTVTIVTPTRKELLYVQSRQPFVSKDSLLYTLIDENKKECSFRIVLINQNSLELYYYSDRVDEKYYRLKLIKKV
jgi:hypothetical protein